MTSPLKLHFALDGLTASREPSTQIVPCYGFHREKKGSAWSKRNKEPVEKLVSANRMHAAGLAKVEEAKQDGNWNKLDKVEALEVPPDLQKAFQSHPGSKSNFDAFPRSTKRAILEWIGNAKTDATRAKRVSETAALAPPGRME
jgi:uncharacterized protein YdeI (YjbR/CyaY-like superfamily)